MYYTYTRRRRWPNDAGSVGVLDMPGSREGRMRSTDAAEKGDAGNDEAIQPTRDAQDVHARDAVVAGRGEVMVVARAKLAKFVVSLRRRLAS